MTAISPCPLKTTTTTMSNATTVISALSKGTTINSIPVRAIPVPNTNKLILAGPCIVFRPATVAERVQALRQEKKAASTVTAATSTTTSAANGNGSATAVVKSEPRSPELLRCKRRADLGKLGFPEAKPASVSRRNARERNRVKLVNQGFDTLREHVPNGKKNRKMSKVDTLKNAVDYIQQLRDLIREHDEQMETSPSGTDSSSNTSEEMKAGGEEEIVQSVKSESEQSVCNQNVSVSSPSDMSVAQSVRLTHMGIMKSETVVKSSDIIDENVINNNNNNNNKVMNFNLDNNTDTSNCNVQVKMDTLAVSPLANSTVHQMNGVEQMSTVPQQLSTFMVLNNAQNLNSANSVQRTNNINNTPQLVNLNSLNASAFINTSSLIAPTSSSTTSLSGTISSPSSTVNSTTIPSTITVITLPVQTSVSQQPSSSSNDDVFLTDLSQRIQTTSSPPTSLSALTTGTIATLTTLQGVGSLSGQGLTITQPCRRQLSFTEPERERPVPLQPKLSLSEQSQTLLTGNYPQQQQQQETPQQISFTLLPGQSTASLLNTNNLNTLTLVQQQTLSPQQQQQQQQQPQQTHQEPEQPQFTTLSNMSLPDQSMNATFSFDQSSSSGSFPLTDNHSYHNPSRQLQTRVAPNNMAMMQPQLQVDQVPSPSLSTTSSHTSESSYDSYESLGSIEEEDLQDLSKWLSEICYEGQDIASHCDNGEGVFLVDNEPL